MNALLSEMKRSLAELDLGLKGDLTISEPMEKLMNSLANDAVPGMQYEAVSLQARFPFRQLEKSGISISEAVGIMAQQSTPKN